MAPTGLTLAYLVMRNRDTGCGERRYGFNTKHQSTTSEWQAISLPGAPTGLTLALAGSTLEASWTRPADTVCQPQPRTVKRVPVGAPPRGGARPMRCKFGHVTLNLFEETKPSNFTVYEGKCHSDGHKNHPDMRADNVTILDKLNKRIHFQFKLFPTVF